MKTQDLSLFDLIGNNPIKPLETSTAVVSHSPYKTLDNALSSIFQSNGEETKAQRTRKLLGSTATEIPDDQINVINTEFQSFIDIWLDQFEQHIFEGKTLRELIGEKDYAHTNQ